MPFWRICYQLICGTKNHHPLITCDLEPALFSYLIGKAAEKEIKIRALNGWTDHIHLIVSIPPKLSITSAVNRHKETSALHANVNCLTASPFIVSGAMACLL